MWASHLTCMLAHTDMHAHATSYACVNTCRHTCTQSHVCSYRTHVYSHMQTHLYTGTNHTFSMQTCIQPYVCQHVQTCMYT